MFGANFQPYLRCDKQRKLWIQMACKPSFTVAAVGEFNGVTL